MEFVYLGVIPPSQSHGVWGEACAAGICGQPDIANKANISYGQPLT